MAAAAAAGNLTFSVRDWSPAASAHLRVPPGPEKCEDCERRRKRDARKEPNSAWKLRALRGFAESSSQRALTHGCCTRNEGFINPCWALPPHPPPVREGLFVLKLEFSSCLIRYCPNDPELLGLTQLAFLIKLVFLVNETCWGIYLTHFCVSIAVVPVSGWTTSVSHCFVY